MNTLTYAGKNLADFGVYFDSSQIFNKPEKLFNSFAVPNRNGNLMSSLRKFNNIEIVYSCYIKENFADNYNNLIDYLTSFDTYQKLENSVEPLSYRMGIYHAETLVDTGQFLKGGQFSLSFDCKPQNFFNSGDELTQVNVYSDGNWWYDTGFTLGDINVTYADGVYALRGYNSNTSGATRHANIPIPQAGSWLVRLYVTSPDTQGIGANTTASLEAITRPLNVGGGAQVAKTTTGASSVSLDFTIAPNTTGTLNAEVTCTMYKTDGQAPITTLTNPSRKASKPLFIYEEVGHPVEVTINSKTAFEYTPPTGTADSDGTLYVDCELMDCYLLKNDGTIENYNPHVLIDGDFPETAVGENTFTTDYGTVYIKPRWWKL